MNVLVFYMNLLFQAISALCLIFDTFLLMNQSCNFNFVSDRNDNASSFSLFLQQHIRKFHENAFQEPIACQLCCNGVKQLRSRKYHTPSRYAIFSNIILSGFESIEFVSEFGGSVKLSLVKLQKTG